MTWPPRWYERLPKDWQEVVDQLGHVGIGGGPAAVIGGTMLLACPPWASGLAGAAVGCVAMAVYEAIQNLGDKNNDLRDLRLDLGVGCSAAISVGVLVASFG